MHERPAQHGLLALHPVAYWHIQELEAELDALEGATVVDMAVVGRLVVLGTVGDPVGEKIRVVPTMDGFAVDSEDGTTFEDGFAVGEEIIVSVGSWDEGTDGLNDTALLLEVGCAV